MQLKQLAEDFLGIDKKELIAFIEAKREDFTAQGFKLAKKLTAASKLDEELAKLLLAEYDTQRQALAEKEKAENERRHREEEERRRAAEEIQRKKEEEERAAQVAEAARRAKEEAARRQAAEMARQREEAARRAAAEAQQATVGAPDTPPRPAAPPGIPTQRRTQAPAPVGEGPAIAHPAERTHAPETTRPAARDDQRTAPRGRHRPDSHQQRPGQPGAGQRRPGDKPTAGEERPAKQDKLLAFVEQGLEAGLVEERRPHRRPPAKAKTSDSEVKDWKAEKPRQRPKGVEDPGKKRIRPTQLFNLDAIGDRRGKGRKKPAPGAASAERAQVEEAPRVIKLQGDFTVGEFADKIGVPPADVIKRLFLMGEHLTINQLLDPDKAEELALEMEVEIDIQREDDQFDIAEYIEPAGQDDAADLRPRPPVVTVMGHVDHGKTSLLDRIRKADVASHEHGGITQHIGAYHVESPKGAIVFLDTPGHEAFTEMRSRGANITDLVVLVVAANDGVMPQTVEAINHAKAAGVPILVAINKIDVPGANPDRVKQELMRHELIAEDYGGDTIMVPVSAISGQGIDDLLDYIALQTEVLELKANPNANAVGTVVEARIDPLRGSVATVLIRRGTLRIGDAFVCGSEYGRVRAMRNDRGAMITEAGPTDPVEILGLSGAPTAGEDFVAVPSENTAREIAEKRVYRRRLRKASGKQHLSLDNLAEQMTEGQILQLNLIIKGDVQGSIEAVCNGLLRIRSDKVVIKILHSAVGAVSQADVQLADASSAIILAFHVGTDPAARDLAEEAGVDIRTYHVIYALLEDIQAAMVGMLAPEFEEKSEGRAKVLQTFKVSRLGTIAGCFVEEGTVAISHRVRLFREGAVLWTGKIKSLRRVKEDVKQVLSGLECGIALDGYNDIKEGDVIETFSLVQQEASLISSEAHRVDSEALKT